MIILSWVISVASDSVDASRGILIYDSLIYSESIAIWEVAIVRSGEEEIPCSGRRVGESV